MVRNGAIPFRKFARMQHTDNFRSSLWIVGSMGLFAIEDLLVKILSASVTPGQMIALFGLGGAVMFGAMALRQGGALVSRALLHPAVMTRNLSEAAATMSFVTALAHIPMSTNSAILQSAPLLVTIAAALFLGERVGWRRWSAIAVGLVGVLMILRPGPEGVSWMALLSLASTVALVTRDISTRLVPPTVSTFQLTTWAYGILVPAGAVLMLAQGQSLVLPDLWGAVGLGLAFLTSVGGYYAVTHAMRIGEASVVAPFRYTRLVFALILAVLVLDERPDGWVMAGAALVVGSGLYTLARTRKKKAATLPSPEAGPRV